MSEPFIVTEASTWIARGRSPEHAEALAQAWRDFPDLPPSAPAEARMTRTRERVSAMRPVNDAIAEQAARQREVTNFAFIEQKLARSDGGPSEVALLRGRDKFGYTWLACVRYSEGWYAGYAGWAHRPPPDNRAAYDQGFADAGGNADDIFDAARRSLIAAHRDVSPIVATPVPTRPLPSTWPKPSDAHRPVAWPHRLLLIAEHPASIAMLDATSGAAIIVLTSIRGFVPFSELRSIGNDPMSAEQADALIADPAQHERPAALLAGRNIDDILVAADGEYLRVIDAHAKALPLCRSMERVRNTPLQQRQHLRLWQARGIALGENLGAGHIRWGKRAKSLSAKLGEFTAREASPITGKGGRILVTLPDGAPATGFATSSGTPLEAEILITNKSRLKVEMERVLRAFGAATRLGAGALLVA